MIFPCSTKSLCFDPANPLTNFSAEAPDQPVFIARNTGYGPLLPPLGSDWVAFGCTALCESTVSQQDADLCAAANNINCLATAWPVTAPGTDVFGNPVAVPSPRKVFKSRSQTTTVFCPDGNSFKYTVNAGKFSAFSQAQADADALSYAKAQAPNFILCMGALSPAVVCSETPYEGSITASGPKLTDGSACWSIIGQLPDGISSDLDESGSCVTGSNTLNFFGTPTTPGIYPFAVRVKDPTGDFMVKSFSLRVAGITNGDSFANGTVGTTYSQNVDSAGVINPIYSLESGALPDGLSLDSGGIIFGTPTKNGTFDFTLGVTEAGTGVTCNADCSIKIGGCGPVPAQAWTKPFTQTAQISFRNHGTPLIIMVGSSFSFTQAIRLDNQNVQSTIGFEGVGVGYAPNTDNFYSNDSGGNLWTITPDPLNAVAFVAAPFFGNCSPLVYFNGLLYMASNPFNGVLNFQINVFDPITGTFLNSGMLMPNSTPASQVSIDEVGKFLYGMRNDQVAQTVNITQWDISVNPPVLLQDVPIPTLGGDPSGGTACIFCPTNGQVYCAAVGQGGAQLIRYDPNSQTFSNPTNLDNNANPFFIAFNPVANLVLVPDNAVIRVVCADSDAEIGQIPASMTQLIYASTNQSVVGLGTDNLTLTDFA